MDEVLHDDDAAFLWKVPCHHLRQCSVADVRLEQKVIMSLVIWSTAAIAAAAFFWSRSTEMTRGAGYAVIGLHRLKSIAKTKTHSPRTMCRLDDDVRRIRQTRCSSVRRSSGSLAKGISA